MNMVNLSVEKKLNSDTKVRDQIDDLVIRIIAERKKQQITQTILSQLAGIPQPTISRLESFRSIPTLEVIIKLSNALGLSIYLDNMERHSYEV
jgi:transcriptional regulator with XRE-family HTH domain